LIHVLVDHCFAVHLVAIRKMVHFAYYGFGFNPVHLAIFTVERLKS